MNPSEQDRLEALYDLQRRGQITVDHMQRMLDESRKIARQLVRLPKQGAGDFQPNLIFITHAEGFTPVAVPKHRNAAVKRILVARRRSYDRAVTSFNEMRAEVERLIT